MTDNRDHPSGRPLLQVKNLGKRFGGIQALDGFSIDILPGELVGLIGPNGAGKTTVFNLLSGVIPPSSGQVYFSGRDITGLRPDQSASLGLARTFQNIRLFGEMTVLDNIKVAQHMRLGRGFWGTLFHTPRYRRSEREMETKCLEFLELLELDTLRHEPAKNLPYGIQRRVEIARALASLPSLILLDEPAAGLNPKETDDLIETIQRIHQEYGLTLFLVEHDMRLVMSICQRIQVIDRGATLTSGSPREIRNDSRVIEAYLGKSAGGGNAQHR